MAKWDESTAKLQFSLAWQRSQTPQFSDGKEETAKISVWVNIPNPSLQNGRPMLLVRRSPESGCHPMLIYVLI